MFWGWYSVMGLELPVWGAPTAAWIVATLGLVGASVLDRFLDDDGSDDDDSGDRKSVV